MNIELLNKILSKVGDLGFKRRVIKILENLNLEDTDIVLDAGCGEGFYSMIFDHLFKCKIYAIDNDLKLLDMAKLRLEGSLKVSFASQDISKLNFKDNYFDKILCTEVLEHIEDTDLVLKEFYRVLKPGGIIVITVPNSNYPLLYDPLNKIREYFGLGHFNAKNEILGGVWSYDHKRLYSPILAKSMVERGGFKIIKLNILTRFVFPFYYLILNIGKKFYTRLPVSKSISSSMEKFDWNKDQNKSHNNIIVILINTVFSFFKWIDSFNDRELNTDSTALTILICATKE